MTKIAVLIGKDFEDSEYTQPADYKSAALPLSYASPFLRMLISQGFAGHKRLSEELSKAIRMLRRAACPTQSASKHCGPRISGVADINSMEA